MNVKKKSLLMACLCMTISGTALAASPYEDVAWGSEVYAEITALAESGLINKSYGTFYNSEQVGTRLEIAAIVANASTKYEQANDEQKAYIEALQQEFAPELTSMGIKLINPPAELTPDKPSQESVTDLVKEIETKQKETDEKLSWLPRISGNVKERYDYKVAGSGANKSSWNKLYQDIRIDLSGDINKDWHYLFGWQIIGMSQANSSGQMTGGTNLDYRDTLNPDTQMYMAEIHNWNFLGGRIFLGKYWNGFVTDLEPAVYVDAIRGVGYAHPVGKNINASVSWGKLDWNPANYEVYDADKMPTGLRFTLEGKFGKTFLGAAYWKFKDFYVPQTYAYNPVEKMTKLYEGQITHNFDDRNSLSYFYAHSDSASQNNLHIVRYKYGKDDIKKPGSYSIALDWHSIGANSVLDPGVVEAATFTTGSNYNGSRGFGLNLHYVLAKNLLFMTELNPWNRDILDSSTKVTTMRSTLQFVY